MFRKPALNVVEGEIYVYKATWPPACKGCRYRVVRLVMAVPAYQEQVVVEALEGPDKGRWFVCSPWNFANRYERLEEATVAVVGSVA